MSRRILLLSSTWGTEYSKEIIDGILERAENEDIKLHIFNAYDTGRETEYYTKGREIYALPSPDWYDGMISSLITVGSLKYSDEIIAKFHGESKPVVSLNPRTDKSLFCGLDDYRSMYQLVEHMITIHDCRTFNFLGGPKDNDENAERYRAFCDCLEAHGIRVEKKRVLFKNFWKSNGNDAYNEWKEFGVNLADVVICANDYMALGYVEEAMKDGIAIPDYMKVTGFDNIREAQKYSPSITSVNRNWKHQGYESLDALLEAVNGNSEYDTRFVEGYVSYNESCGCDLTRDIRADYNSSAKSAKKGLENDLKHSYSRQALFNSHSMEEFKKALSICKETLMFDDLAVCLNKSFFDGEPDRKQVGYDEDMIMYTDVDEIRIKRSEQLYPQKWEDTERVLLFSSLRDGDQTYGYLVMPYREKYLDSFKHRIFVESLSIALTLISNRVAIDKLKGTGIFNI